MVGGLQSVSFPVQAVGDPAPIPVTFFVCGPDPAKQPKHPGQTGHWLCFADCQLWHPYSALVSLGYSAFQMFHQLPGQVGLRPSLRSGPDHDLAHMPGRVQTRRQGWQISSFKDPDQETYTLTPLPCQTAPLTWFYTWAKLPVGIAVRVLQVCHGTQSAMTPVPGFSPAPPYFSITVRLPVVSPHGVPHNLHGARPELGLPGSNTHAAELDLHPGLSCPPGGATGSGDLCRWGVTSLAEGRCGQHAAAAPTFLIWPVLVGLVQECFSPSLVFQDSLGSGVLSMNSC